MKNNRKVKAIAGLLALALVVGTIAFFSEELSLDNPFETKKYGGEMIEKFTPEKDWEPGEQITKEVQVKNRGDYPLYVRVKFDEKWTRNGSDFKQFSSTDGTSFFPSSADTSATDGSSVYKHLVGVNDGTWIDGKDGYFYYKQELAKSAITSKLMDYVTLCKDADMGSYTETELKYAIVDESVTAESLKDSDYNLTSLPEEIPEGKVVYQKKMLSIDESNRGLAEAKYTLTITTQLVQATEDAAAGWSYIPSK